MTGSAIALSSSSVAPYDFAPAASLLLLGALLALGPLWWVWRRHAGLAPASRPAARLQALTLLTLCLTFDLVLFGAFTRLTDSGLGCPDWPGCYGSTSPLGAHVQIDAAQSALPSGPVTHGKAWIEMTHRYLATGVGALIAVLVGMSGWGAWRARSQSARVSARWPGAPPASAPPHSGAPPPLFSWALVTLVWVCMQGLFGALTVTLKLQPLVVTAHLLGGLGLLALLAAQAQLQRRQPLGVAQRMPRGLHRFALGLAALSVLQIALGGWVSTHYAVLACGEFPRCQGSWWPAMDFHDGFKLLRDLGTANADPPSFAALTAIHYVHRLGAYLVLGLMAVFAWRLWRTDDPGLRRWASATAAIAGWQLATGISNVVLGWPLVAAVGHTAGAAAWVVLLASMLTRVSVSQAAHPAQAGHPGRAVSGRAPFAVEAGSTRGRFRKMRSSPP